MWYLEFCHSRNELVDRSVCVHRSVKCYFKDDLLLVFCVHTVLYTLGQQVLSLTGWRRHCFAHTPHWGHNPPRHTVTCAAREFLFRQRVMSFKTWSQRQTHFKRHHYASPRVLPAPSAMAPRGAAGTSSSRLFWVNGEWCRDLWAAWANSV